jgi:integrase
VVAYHLGNRLGELRRLRWDRVDLQKNQIRLNPGETKNNRGRVLPIYGEMRHWLQMQKAIRDAKFPACSCVFHHDGKPILDFRKAWRSATQRADLEGTLFHDLRRSAVRNMREAGIPENVAMEISGHQTRSIFERYNIVSDRDLKAAAEKMQNRFKQSIKSIARQRGLASRSVQ